MQAWQQAWRAWDAQRPGRDGLVNPAVPDIHYGRNPGHWMVGEHLLGELDEWHPAAELSKIGFRYTAMRGDDVMACVLALANA